MVAEQVREPELRLSVCAIDDLFDACQQAKSERPPLA